MSPIKSIVLGIVLNLITVFCMERVKGLWKGAPLLFEFENVLLYALIAVTIVATQFLLIQAGQAEGFPMYVAIGILIAFVLTGATLNGCRAQGRWPTWGEVGGLEVLISAAFVLQYVSSRAEQAHLDHQRTAAARD